MRTLKRLKAAIKTPVFWFRFAAYALPGAFLLYVLYWNFLPFGYDKTFTITVGAPGDTDSSREFYLKPSDYLGEPQTVPDGMPGAGTTYRELLNSTVAVFQPRAVLRNATITASVVGDGVSIIPPHIDFDPTTVKWDYDWDFTKGVIPPGLEGEAVPNGDPILAGTAPSMYFDGSSKLELPNSANKAETTAFTIYASWTPEDPTKNFQEIFGHYNWELLQNSTSVEFRVGRMNDITGAAYSIKYPIDAKFFETKHTALAIYNPGGNGYIELYVDGNFADRIYFGAEKIWREYGGNKNISFGKSDHGIAQYFTGSLYEAAIVPKNILSTITTTTFIDISNDALKIPISASSISNIKQITIHAIQK